MLTGFNDRVLVFQWQSAGFNKKYKNNTILSFTYIICTRDICTKQYRCYISIKYTGSELRLGL